MKFGIEFIYYWVGENFLIRFNDPPAEFGHNKEPKRKVEAASPIKDLGKKFDKFG